MLESSFVLLRPLTKHKHIDCLRTITQRLSTGLRRRALCRLPPNPFVPSANQEAGHSVNEITKHSTRKQTQSHALSLSSTRRNCPAHPHHTAPSRNLCHSKALQQRHVPIRICPTCLSPTRRSSAMTLPPMHHQTRPPKIWSSWRTIRKFRIALRDFTPSLLRRGALWMKAWSECEASRKRWR